MTLPYGAAVHGHGPQDVLISVRLNPQRVKVRVRVKAKVVPRHLRLLLLPNRPIQGLNCQTHATHVAKLATLQLTAHKNEIGQPHENTALVLQTDREKHITHVVSQVRDSHDHHTGIVVEPQTVYILGIPDRDTDPLPLTREAEVATTVKEGDTVAIQAIPIMEGDSAVLL